MKFRVLILTSLCTIAHQTVISKNKSNARRPNIIQFGSGYQNNDHSMKIHGFNILKNGIIQNPDLSLNQKKIAINKLSHDILMEIPYNSAVVRRSITNSAREAILRLEVSGLSFSSAKNLLS